MAGESEMSAATAKKKPLSLNERHSLLLSASHSKRPPSTTSSLFSLGLEDDDPSVVTSPPVDRLPSKAPLDGLPDFSGTVDSDSPFAKSEISDHAKDHASDDDVEECSEVADYGHSPDVLNSPANEFESSDVDHDGDASDDDVEECSEVADYGHSPDVLNSPANEFESSDVDHDGDGSVEKRSDIADFDPFTEGEEIKKVKIQGRRRLCKVTSVQRRDQVQADGADEYQESADDSGTSTGLISAEKEKVKLQGRRRLCKVAPTNKNCDPNVNTDESFGGRDVQDISDFSSPQPTKMAVKNDGENEIRDILNELSAKFDFLSIDKKRNVKPVEYKATQVEEDIGDYASADSSFSKSSNSSGSSSGARKGTDEMVAKGGLSELERDKFGSEAFVDEKPAVPSKAFVHDVDDGEDSEDDCVVLESENVPRGKKDVASLGTSRAMERLDRDEGKEIASEHDDSITLKGPRSTYRLPGKIGKMLYPHQREGLKWLWTLHCQGKGGILGDDMGLGKTMQICGFLVGLFHSKLTRRAIVVAPKTLIPHWIKELGVVGLSAKTKEFIGTCQKARQYELQYVLQDGGILLTTYDIVRNNWKQLCRGHSLGDEDDEEDPIWDYMILDEGHLIKNPSTQRAQSLLSVPCAHRIVISGTPIQNNLKELWALFHFCCPDLLGDKKWFKERYENPILRGNDKKATERERRIGSTIAKELRDHIQPYFLRRLKSEVFSEESATDDVKLSKKNEVIVWLRLTSVQRRLYEAFLNSELVLSSFDGSPLAAITILKKICDHPYLLTKRAAEDVLDGMDSTLQGEDRDLAAKLAKHVADFSGEDDFGEKHDNVSCKISFILSLLENLIPQGHNVLIFSQTRKMLNHIQESLTSNGFQYQRIDGTTKACDRLSIVNDFQEGRGAPIFMLTSQVGGLGLTLTKADRVIVVDPAWNPSTDSQSVDRAYRIGQKKDVIVYRLMTCGTIEEKIYRMQIFKGGLFKTATEHKEQTRYFSKQDLKELFSLPKDGFDVSPTQQQLHEEHSHQIVMSDSLKAHMKFLESLGIGGVSHHSLLYSKTEPTPPPAQEEELARAREVMRTNAMYPSHVPKRRDDDGAEFSKYAFNPRDARIQDLENKPSPDSIGKMTESQIMEKIGRLSKLLSNKATIARLPDGGNKIRKQLEDLNAELTNLRNPKNNEVIDLDDDLYDALSRSLKI